MINHVWKMWFSLKILSEMSMKGEINGFHDDFILGAQ